LLSVDYHEPVNDAWYRQYCYTKQADRDYAAVDARLNRTEAERWTHTATAVALGLEPAPECFNSQELFNVAVYRTLYASAFRVAYGMAKPCLLEPAYRLPGSPRVLVDIEDAHPPTAADISAALDRVQYGNENSIHTAPYTLWQPIDHRLDSSTSNDSLWPGTEEELWHWDLSHVLRDPPEPSIARCTRLLAQAMDILRWQWCKQHPHPDAGPQQGWERLRTAAEKRTHIHQQMYLTSYIKLGYLADHYAAVPSPPNSPGPCLSNSPPRHPSSPITFPSLTPPDPIPDLISFTPLPSSDATVARDTSNVVTGPTNAAQAQASGHTISMLLAAMESGGADVYTSLTPRSRERLLRLLVGGSGPVSNFSAGSSRATSASADPAPPDHFAAAQGQAHSLPTPDELARQAELALTLPRGAPGVSLGSGLSPLRQHAQPPGNSEYCFYPPSS
jgi:hypothetical protein